jgi:hypothetical protein
MVDGVGTTLCTDGAGQLLSEAGPWTGGSVVNTYSNRLRQTFDREYARLFGLDGELLL